MKKTIIILLSAVLAFTMCFAAFAQEETEEVKNVYPVVGSWKLDQVFEVKETSDPILLKKEEAQSLYGSGISIFSFDEDGYARNIMFDAGDMVDVPASWKSTSPDVYIYTEEDGFELKFSYDEKEDVLHRTFQDDAPDATYKNLDFVYTRAFVGSWTLDQVLAIHDGDAPEELAKEEHQSLYGTDESILTLYADGKVKEEIKEGPNASVNEGTWEMLNPDKIVYTQDSLEMELEYFLVDDTLFRDYKDESPDAPYPHLQFVYVRVETGEEEPVQEETKTANQPVEQPAPQPASQPATQAPAQDDNPGELIADGQIFTGYTMYLYAPEGGGVLIEVSELNQGGWADPNTGVIYEQEAGGGYHFYGSDGSVWVTEGYFNEFPVGSNGFDDNAWDDGLDELIADGQIFTGYTMYLYAPEGGGVLIEVSELNQGGWADPNTGVIYEQEAGGGYHFYGSDGSVWVTEAYFNEYPVGSNGLDD
ncbi:MAG: hypothetical protein IJ106_05795 [Parasporobacterium sp.]|nr:hypothetical protein [Parasporobacterium sp.]